MGFIAVILETLPPSSLKYNVSLFTYKVPYPLPGVLTSPLSFIKIPSESNFTSPSGFKVKCAVAPPASIVLNLVAPAASTCISK
jgi:hypothetical protein